jgi:Fe2+ or Zn2+ uptake regulation protein
MSESNEHLRDAFRAAGLRLTSQRQLILSVLKESNEHLDADTLYDQAKARASDISLATVYRTLSVLREMGLVEEHRLGEEHYHYEAVREEPHYHFTCRECGEVIEFDTPLVAQIEQELSEQEGVRVTNAHLHLTGYCAQCKDKAGEQSNHGKKKK